MNENIDLKEILKDCPIGWKFYSSIYGDVTFRGIENYSEYPVKFFFIDKDNSEKYGSVTEQGLYASCYNGECTFFPSKDQRDWNKFIASWYKKERFDPKTLQAFDKVLVRDRDGSIWFCEFFSHILKQNAAYKYATISAPYRYCIPYNEETKHLVGTTDNAPLNYRYWDD